MVCVLHKDMQVEHQRDVQMRRLRFALLVASKIESLEKQVAELKGRVNELERARSRSPRR